MNRSLTRKIGSVVVLTSTAFAAAAVPATSASAQNGNYFVETDYVRIHEQCNKTSRTVAVMPPNVPVTGIRSWEYGPPVNGIAVYWRLANGCISSAWDTSSFRTEADIWNKYGIPRTGSAPIQGGAVCIQGSCGTTTNVTPRQEPPVRAGQPSGPAQFKNAAIADWLLARVGQRLGECRAAANAAVAALSNGRLQLGGEPWDYRAGFRRVGAHQVTDVNKAVAGDVVQVGDGIHTYVVVANLGSGNLRVVDSNHASDGIVRTYMRNYDYRGYAAKSTIWRIGQL